jgi:predicted RNA-binding Zn ribbon-like protein
MKDYGHVLQDDPEWAERGAAFSAKVRDVTELLADSEPVPRLSDHGGGRWHLHVGSRTAGPAARLRAITSLGLALVLAEEGRERLGLCADQDCGAVFVDSSKNLSRRYCCEGCSNRANVRAYRARHRAPEAGPV